MSHPDPDALALAALDERVDDGTVAHLQHCEQCRTELADLRRVVRAARYDDNGPVAVSAPPPHVWERIADEVLAGPRDEQAGPSVTSRREGAAARREGERRRWVPTLAAAAVGLVVGATGTGVVVSVLGGDPADPRAPSATTTVATADLQPLSAAGSPGSASVVRADGERVLRLRVPQTEASQAGGFREVWLLDTEQGRLVSLGVLEGRRGSFTLPADLDLADYPTVDVSAEPFDGDPTHSGDSLVRGDLTF